MKYGHYGNKYFVEVVLLLLSNGIPHAPNNGKSCQAFLICLFVLNVFLQSKTINVMFKYFRKKVPFQKSFTLVKKILVT